MSRGGEKVACHDLDRAFIRMIVREHCDKIPVYGSIYKFLEMWLKKN